MSESGNAEDVVAVGAKQRCEMKKSITSPQLHPRRPIFLPPVTPTVLLRLKNERKETYGKKN